MLRIAITGGIACGKSRMAAYLRESGIAVCDADDIAHDILENNSSVIESIRRQFGADVINSGGVDRRKLSKLVFDDAARLQTLNALVHPEVKLAIDRWLEAQAQKNVSQSAVIIPLLFEAGMQLGWDAVICVVCSPDIQMARLRQRGLSETDAAKRIAAQLPVERKAALSDYVINNNGTVEQFSGEIEKVFREIGLRFTKRDCS